MSNNKKPKNIQIPEQLLIDLCNYHLAGIRSTEQEQRIRQGLQKKLDSVRRRADYQKRTESHRNDFNQ